MKNSAKKKRVTPPKHDVMVSGWCKQAKWVVETIVRLDRSPTAHGLKWTQKMLLHYKKNYDCLRKDTPPLCEEKALEHDIVINRIFGRYCWEGLI